MGQNNSLGCWLKSNFGRGSDVDENKSGSPVVTSKGWQGRLAASWNEWHQWQISLEAQTTSITMS